MHIKNIIFILLFFLLNGAGLRLSAQMPAGLEQYRDSVINISKQLLQSKTDDRKTELNKRLLDFVGKIAAFPDVMEYKLDTFRYVSVVTSPDKKLRFYTWPVRFRDGTYKYYGYVQSYTLSSRSYRTQPLIDYTQRLGRADSKTLYAKKWYGAYYYRLIQTKSGSKTYYTLLGWKGYDKIITEKVIEIANLKSNGDVVFGYPMFNIRDYAYFKNKRARRLIYKYSSRVQMYLDYDVQTLVVEKKKKKSANHKKKKGFNAQNKEVKESVKVKTYTKPMIVVDRMVPPTAEMEGVYEFYIPETNIIDALIFEGNRWTYYPDVDARNKQQEPNGIKPKKKLYFELY